MRHETPKSFITRGNFNELDSYESWTLQSEGFVSSCLSKNQFIDLSAQNSTLNSPMCWTDNMLKVFVPKGRKVALFQSKVIDNASVGIYQLSAEISSVY